MIARHGLDPAHCYLVGDKRQRPSDRAERRHPPDCRADGQGRSPRVPEVVQHGSPVFEDLAEFVQTLA